MRAARPSTIAVLPTPGSPISTGLFFVRRDRICITRSISVWRPTTGSSFPSEACFVRLRPNWSRSFELFALADDARDLRAHLFHGDVERLEHACGEALLLAKEAEQDVLRPDVVVLQSSGFVLGEDDYL